MPIRTITADALDDALVERFASGNGVLWMGAGVSQARKHDATGRPLEPGVPGVGPLTNRLMERDLFTDNWWLDDFVEAASRFVQQHGRPALNDILRQWYSAAGYAVAAPRFYTLLGQLPPQVWKFATTNYDPFTERAVAHRNPVVVVRDLGAQNVLADRPAVYKVHGDANDPDGCVISGADYISWEHQTPLLQGALTQMFTQDTVVMVGYRARDPHFVRLLYRVAAAIGEVGGRPHPVYVAIPNPEPRDFAVVDELGLDLVLINGTGDQFLEALLAKLQVELNRRVAEQLQAVVDALDVSAARAALNDARRNAVEPADWTRVARLHRELAIVLDRDKRWGESLTQRAHLVDALRKRGNDDDASQELTVLLNHALEQHRMPPAVQFRAQECMREGEYDGASVRSKLEMFLAAGRLYASAGGEAETIRMAERIQGINVGADPDLVRLREFGLHQLRAEGAQVGENYRAAVAHWNGAAKTAPDGATRISCEIRAALCTGLGTALEVGVTALRAIAPTDATRYLHESALGWLLALSGEVADAAEHFRNVAQGRIAQLDVARGSASLRNASWAENQGAALVVRVDSGAAQAARLARASVPDAQKVLPLSDVLRDAYSALAFERIRDARDPAFRAAGLAIAECDPHSLEHARTALAELWIRAATLQPTSEELLLAARYTALTCAVSTTGRETSQLDHVASLLRSSATVETIQAIVVDVTGRAVGRFERTSMLRFLREIVDLVPISLHQLLVHVIAVGLRREWSVNTRVDEFTAACELGIEAASSLSPEQVVDLRAEVLQKLPQTPAVRLDRLMRLLAELIEAAPVTAEGATNIAEPLLALVGTGLPDDLQGSVRVVLSILGPRVAEPTRDLIVTAIAPGDDVLDWNTRFRLWQIDRQPSQEEADQFFSEQAEVLTRELGSEPSDAAFFGLGLSRPLYHVAEVLAPLASPGPRDHTLGLALRMVHHAGELWLGRARWARFASIIAKEPGDLQGDAVTIFSQALRGDTPTSVALGEDMTHPLSSIQIREADKLDLQVQAGVALSRVHMGAPRDLRQRIERELLWAAARAKTALRRVGISELGRIMRDGQCTSDPISLVFDALALGTADDDAEVRGIAYNALRRVERSPEADGTLRARAREVLDRTLPLETSALAWQLATRAA